MFRDRHLRARILVAVGLSAFALVACNGGQRSTASTPAVSRSSRSEAAAGVSMRGERYCEVLLVRPGATGGEAEVYSTWTLNECPAEQWGTVDMAAVAAEQGVPLALANGPRFWSMDGVMKTPMAERVRATFGGIDMLRLATVSLGPLADLGKAYLPRPVDRQAVFTYAAGSTVHELTAPGGPVYVMQSWSRQIDPALDEAALVDLTPRLNLPPGWTYSTRVLADELRVATIDRPAMVLQDDLRNSYSQVTSP